jgi:hypothetical protein
LLWAVISAALSGLTGRWRGELLGDLAATKDAAALLAGIGADRQTWRAEETLRRLGGRPAGTAGRFRRTLDGARNGGSAAGR